MSNNIHIIKWRTNGTQRVIVGLGWYSSRQRAEAQAARWQAEFPHNRYYVEPANR